MAAAAVLSAACDGYVRADVEVRDQSGRALPGVRLQFAPSGTFRSHFDLTDLNGRVNIGATVAPGRHEIPLYAGMKGFSSCMVRLPTSSRNELVIVLPGERDGRSATASLVSDSKKILDSGPCETRQEEWTPPEVIRLLASLQTHSWSPSQGTPLRPGDRISTIVRWHVEGLTVAANVSLCLTEEVRRPRASVSVAAVLGCQPIAEPAGSVRLEIAASALVDSSGSESLSIHLWPSMYAGDPAQPENLIGGSPERYRVSR